MCSLCFLTSFLSPPIEHYQKIYFYYVLWNFQRTNFAFLEDNLVTACGFTWFLSICSKSFSFNTIFPSWWKWHRMWSDLWLQLMVTFFLCGVHFPFSKNGTWFNVQYLLCLLCLFSPWFIKMLLMENMLLQEDLCPGDAVGHVLRELKYTRPDILPLSRDRKALRGSCKW